MIYNDKDRCVNRHRTVKQSAKTITEMKKSSLLPQSLLPSSLWHISGENDVINEQKRRERHNGAYISFRQDSRITFALAATCRSILRKSPALFASVVLRLSTFALRLLRAFLDSRTRVCRLVSHFDLFFWPHVSARTIDTHFSRILVLCQVNRHSFRCVATSKFHQIKKVSDAWRTAWQEVNAHA